MILEKRTDFYGNEYWQGTINGKTIVMDRRTDMYGGTYWQGTCDGKTIVTEVRSDWYGQEYLDVRIIDRSSPSKPVQQYGTGGGTGVASAGVGCIPLIIITVISAIMMYGAWSGIMKSEATEVPVIAVISSLIGAYSGLRSVRRDTNHNESAFSGGFSICWIVSGVLFFIVSTICSVIPTSPEMYARLSFGMILGIAFISALMGAFPAILTGIACAIMRRFSKTR